MVLGDVAGPAGLATGLQAPVSRPGDAAGKAAARGKHPTAQGPGRVPADAFWQAQRQTGFMRVVVTQIGSDGTIERRTVDTAGRGDAFQWEDLITRALAVPLPYRPAPGGAVYHLRVDDRDVMVAEHDLAGPLLGLVTAVLAEGGAP